MIYLYEWLYFDTAKLIGKYNIHMDPMGYMGYIPHKKTSNLHNAISKAFRYNSKTSRYNYQVGWVEFMMPLCLPLV